MSQSIDTTNLTNIATISLGEFKARYHFGKNVGVNARMANGALLFMAFFLLNSVINSPLEAKELRQYDCSLDKAIYIPHNDFSSHQEGEELTYNMLVRKNEINTASNPKVADIKIRVYRKNILTSQFDVSIECFGQALTQCSIKHQSSYLSFLPVSKKLIPQYSFEKAPYALIIPDFKRYFYKIDWKKTTGVEYLTQNKKYPGPFLPNVWVRDETKCNKLGEEK